MFIRNHCHGCEETGVGKQARLLVVMLSTYWHVLASIFAAREINYAYF